MVMFRKRLVTVFDMLDFGVLEEGSSLSQLVLDMHKNRYSGAFFLSFNFQLSMNVKRRLDTNFGLKYTRLEDLFCVDLTSLFVS